MLFSLTYHFELEGNQGLKDVRLDQFRDISYRGYFNNVYTILGREFDNHLKIKNPRGVIFIASLEILCLCARNLVLI